jgi:hypothetical protein
MHYLLNRRCEVLGCKNHDKVIEIAFFGGQVKRVCPQCIGKAMSACLVTPQKRPKGVQQF